MISQRDFIKRLSKRSGYTQRDLEHVLDFVREEVVEIIKENEGVKLFNGLLIEGRLIDEHVGRNPSTGESITIPKKTRIVCKVGPGLKKELA